MKKEIHPEYHLVDVSCVCGATYKIGTTNKEAHKLEICSSCHPFFTGNQKYVDTAGRVEKFKKRYAAAAAKAAEAAN